MADFSDNEDRLLVQLAQKQEAKGKSRMSWALIAKQMASTRKTPEQLRMRLVNLKKRFGNEVARFPRWYFVQRVKRSGCSRREQCNNRQEKKCSGSRDIDSGLCGSLIKLFDEEEDDDDEVTMVSTLTLATAVSTNLENISVAHHHVKKLRRRPKELAASNSRVQQSDVDCGHPESHLIVWEIFQTVTKSDVLQASGKTEYNAGELTARGTSTLMNACKLTTADVFVDVGAGVGNVVAQVALESNVRSCVGVEVRRDLAERGKTLIKHFSTKYPRLHAVEMHAEDICSYRINSPPLFRQATVLFCHNTLFQPEAQLVVERICCVLPRLRVVVLQQPFCPRHRPSCLREFCTLFRQRQSPLTVSVTFTKSQSRLVVFDRI
jgi:hypothetical protein